MEMSDTELFAAYAQDNPDRWQEAVGQVIIHTRFGEGVIIDATKVLHIGFREEVKKFPWKALSNRTYFTAMTLPVGRESLFERTASSHQSPSDKEHHDLQEQRQKARNTRQQQGEHELEELKHKHLGEQRVNSCPEMLKTILIKIQREELLQGSEIQQLQNFKEFAALALFYEIQFRKTRDQWNLVKASRWWREAGIPQRSLRLTEDINTDETRLKAAALTSRGAAYLNMGSVVLAKRRADEALQLDPESPYAYRLMGAIFSHVRNRSEADWHFSKADELETRDHNSSGIIKDADEVIVSHS